MSEAAAGRPGRIVLTTFGSFGDLHPYMAVGLALMARGHQVVLRTSRGYREKIEGEGLCDCQVTRRSAGREVRLTASQLTESRRFSASSGTRCR